MSIFQLPLFQFPSTATCLFELALPLEAESAVDKKLADERDEGHDDGDAVVVSDHLLEPLTLRTWRLTRGRRLRESVSGYIHQGMWRDILNGQISVGMFLSWRMRWETVWAVYGHYVFYWVLA